MDAAVLKDSGLRTLYVFTPPEGQTWGLTFERLKDVLLERDPDEFIKVEESGDRSAKGPSMHFGITLDGEELEAFVLWPWST